MNVIGMARNLLKQCGGILLLLPKVSLSLITTFHSSQSRLKAGDQNKRPTDYGAPRFDLARSAVPSVRVNRRGW